MPRGPKGQKRPGDVIGAAVMVARIATGEIADAMGAEETQGADEEADAGLAGFIWRDFGISQPGMIIRSQVQIFPARAAFAALAFSAPGDSAAGAADPSRFFDIGRDHVSWPVLLITDNGRLWIEGDRPSRLHLQETRLPHRFPVNNLLRRYS